MLRGRFMVSLMLLVLHQDFVLAKNRSRRTLLFHGSSAIGCIVAVAVPIDLPRRTTFLSFNFEANYLLPRNDSFSKLQHRWDPDENVNPIPVSAQNSFLPLTARSVDKIFSRTNFYATFIGYMESFRRNGEQCLLRTICEVSESSMGEHNGVFGNILDILFLPSTSRNEHFSKEFYEAEEHGKSGDCSMYHNSCPDSFLDLISMMEGH